MISKKVISPLVDHPCPCLSLSPFRANRWDPHLEDQPRLGHSGAAVARQRERGRQALASAGRPQQQQGGTLGVFSTNHHSFLQKGFKYVQVCSTELHCRMKKQVCFYDLSFAHFHHLIWEMLCQQCWMSFTYSLWYPYRPISAMFLTNAKKRGKEMKVWNCFLIIFELPPKRDEVNCGFCPADFSWSFEKLWAVWYRTNNIMKWTI